VRFSSDGKRLLTTSFSWWEVRLWDIESGNESWRHEFDAGNPLPLVASFANDSTVVVSSALPNQLSWGEVLDATNGKRLHGLGESVGGGSYFYSKDGRYAWVASASKITIFDPRTAKTVCELPLAPQ
jgi:WD40 repeat protein